MFTFYLGSHVLTHINNSQVPLFVSFRRLRGRKKPFIQTSHICLDSGGFSELSLFGKWTITPDEYIQEVRRLQNDCNISFNWIAQQDWMTEPPILDKTGLSILQHQENTITNYLYLIDIAPDLHIIPVLQGQTIDDYLHHVYLFSNAGIDLTSLPVVGLGSVCRRQNTKEIEQIVSILFSMGISLHGFGVKIQGIKRYSHMLKSADSMAWSFNARYNKEHCSIHMIKPKTLNCANCFQYALEWRSKVIAALEEGGE
jgi:hypothetical protein